MIEQRDKISILYKTHYYSLVLFAMKWVKNKDSACDIVQSVFIKLLENNKLKILNAKAYLFQSVRNACINQLKKNKTEIEYEELINEKAIVDFDNIVEQAEFEAFVFKLIENLAPATKNIFTLNRFKGLSNAEIAEKLNISKKTVELQISNALRFLRKELAKSPEGKTFFTKFIVILFGKEITPI